MTLRALKLFRTALFYRSCGLFLRYWRRCVLLMLTIVAMDALSVVPPILMALIIDLAFPHKDLSLLTLLAFALIVVPIAIGLISIGRDYLNVTLSQRVLYDLRVQLYTHLQKVALRFYTSERTGEIISHLSNDVDGVQDVVINAFSSTFSNGITALTILFVMLRLNSQLTAICLVLVPLFLYLSHRVGKIYRSVSARKQQTLADVSSFLEETLNVSGVLLIKSFGRQQASVDHFTKVNQRLLNVQVHQTMLARWFLLILHTFFAAIPALLYTLGGRQVIFGTLSLGSLIAFTALQASFFSAFRGLLDTHVNIRGAQALFERIFAYLDLPIEITERQDALALNQVRGQIRFRHVHFHYRPDRPTLVDLDFEIQPGQFVALVGPSGAGKTTITYLLARFYDVTEGAIEIDGHDVRSLTLASLAHHIGIVAQETYLLNDTVYANIIYGRPRATMEEVIAAAEAAQIHERILNLPQGYETIIGPRGYILSGGEKQRLAIARVLLKDPRILILDEATSALDTAAERLIQAALARLQSGRTTLTIAHRLSTILAADQILVMDKGYIVERGTHPELLKRGGLYAELYREAKRWTPPSR